MFTTVQNRAHYKTVFLLQKEEWDAGAVIYGEDAGDADENETPAFWEGCRFAILH